MVTETTTSMRNLISALIQGLRIDQLAMIDAAGKLRYREIARSYYEMAASRERCAKELAAVTKPSAGQEDSKFVKQMRDLVADLREALNDEDPYAVLGRTVRMEDAVLEEYKQALSHGSTAPVSKLLQKQYAELREAREAVARLRDQHVPVALKFVSASDARE